MVIKNRKGVENRVVYVILLVSLEIWKYTWKMFLNQWENYSMSTEILYMKLHTLRVSTRNEKVYESDRNQKEITIGVDNKNVNNNSDIGYLLTTGVKTFTSCEIIITI